MVALKNKLVVLGAIGFLVAACTVSSTTTNPGDGGSSGSSGTSGTSGTSGDGGSSGTSGDGGSSSGDSGGTCKALIIQLQPAACDQCAHANCQTPIDACFKDTSPAGCECQLLDDCVQGCLQQDSGVTVEKQCVNDCGTAHPNATQTWLGWNRCVVEKCGVEAGTGACQ